MKRVLAPLLFLIVLLFLVYIFDGLKPTTKTATNDALTPFLANVKIPEANIADEKGQVLPLEKIVDNGTLVTFWSSQCIECRIGLPIIEKFVKANSQVKSVLVNIGETSETAKAALKDYGVEQTTYFDKDGSAATKWAATLPASYYIENNAIKYYFPGRVSEEHLAAIIGK